MVKAIAVYGLVKSQSNRREGSATGSSWRIQINAFELAFDSATPNSGHIKYTWIKRSEKGTVALLLHDAIVFYCKAETEQLEEFVRHDTGFNLKFSEEAY